MTGAAQAMLAGGSLPRVNISDQNLNKLGSGTGSISASYTLSNDGNAYGVDGGSLEKWLKSGQVGDYDCRATVQAGGPVGGTMGTWLNLGTTQQWTVTALKFSERTATLLVEIRDALTLSVLDSATINFDVNNGA